MNAMEYCELKILWDCFEEENAYQWETYSAENLLIPTLWPAPVIDYDYFILSLIQYFHARAFHKFAATIKSSQGPPHRLAIIEIKWNLLFTAEVINVYCPFWSVDFLI